MKTKLTLAVTAVLVLVAGTAFAQPGFGPGMGRGMGHRGMGRGGPMQMCIKGLMMAPPDMLKAKLGLSDQQVTQLQSIRTNVMTKSIKLGSEAKLTAIQIIPLLQSDLPDEAKVLALHRKVHALRGQIAEERIKAGIAVLKVLSKDQRAKLRTDCFSRGKGGGMGKHGPKMGADENGGGGAGGGAGWGAGSDMDDDDDAF